MLPPHFRTLPLGDIPPLVYDGVIEVLVMDGSVNGQSHDIGRVLVAREAIARRVAELGRQIADDYEGRELTIVAVLTGSLIFLADLIRHVPNRMRILPISASSYPGASTEPVGKPRLGPMPKLPGGDVLIVDDILDTGQTLAALIDHCRQQAASVRVCVLLNKKRKISRPSQADYIGFDVGEEFVVGYGLDFDNLYRNLPDIRELRSREGI